MTEQIPVETPQELITEVPSFAAAQDAKTFPEDSAGYDPINAGTMVDFEKQFLPRRLDATELDAIHQKIWDRVSTSPEAGDQNTAELMTYLPPQVGVELGGHTFLLTGSYSTPGGRKHAIGYTEIEEGTIAPRLFYKSNSDGFWRVAPYYDGDQGYYSKGDTMDYGYARETRLNDDLEGLLQTLEPETSAINEGQLSWVLEHFDVKNLGKANTYEDEAFEIKVKGFNDFFEFKPGHGFKTEDGRPAREVLKQMKADTERLPEFSTEPVQVRQAEHTLLGPVQVDSYRSRDGLLVWNMAHTSDGKVWVQGITSTLKNQTTSYGTDWEVLSAGVLDSKPIEYESQVEGLEEGTDYYPTEHRGYVELAVLDNLEPIRKFREARGIQRQRAA